MNCKKCGSHKIRKKGLMRIKSGVRHQYLCMECGYFFRGPVFNEDYGKQTAKILLVDIETARMHVGVWGLGKQVVSMDQIVKDWFILGWSAKWLFSNEVFSDFVTPAEALKRDDERIVLNLWKYIDDASILIGHNIKGFDVPKILTRFIYHQIKPPSPFQLIDTHLAIKPLGFSSNKLKYVTEFLGLKKKLETDYQLWIDCENGDERALSYMEKYCRQDSVALEEMFVELRPYLKTGINIALHNHSGVKCCSTCGSPELVERGYYYTSVSRFVSYQCSNCGSYSRERTSDLSITDRKKLLSPTAR